MNIEAWPALQHASGVGQEGRPLALALNPHSLWCWILASTGLVGAAILLGILSLTSLALFRRTGNQQATLACIGMLIAWCIANTFDSLLLTGQTAAMLGLILCGAFSEPSTRSDLGIRQQPPC